MSGDLLRSVLVETLSDARRLLGELQPLVPDVARCYSPEAASLLPIRQGQRLIEDLEALIELIDDIELGLPVNAGPGKR